MMGLQKQILPNFSRPLFGKIGLIFRWTMFKVWGKNHQTDSSPENPDAPPKLPGQQTAVEGEIVFCIFVSSWIAKNKDKEI